MSLTFRPADFERLAQIVREETGNVVTERNHPMLESRLRTHMSKIGIASMDAYWSHFKTHEREERETLKGLMTTHYTFFFREYAHFDGIESWIEQSIPRLKARYQTDKTPVSVWSAACSRGQEVYSLAMFLEVHLTRKHGLPYEILGTDIDPESLKYAANAVYPINEVSTIPREYLSNFWKRGTGAVANFCAVGPLLKSKAQFKQLNLLELPSAPQRHHDLIMCRNVFIYFSEENVKTMAGNMKNALRPGGLFITGVSEPMRFAGWNLPTVGPSIYHLPVGASNGAAAAVSPTPMRSPAAPVTVAKTQPAAPSPAPIADVVPLVVTKERYEVLCVDDSATIQNLIKKIFAGDPSCVGVDIANNGREARAALDKKKYDLITLDIHMPEMNGIEFLEQAYKRNIDPPVLMISSVNRTDVDLATKAMKLGAFDYVEKPALNAIQKSANEILAKGRMARRSFANANTTQTSTDLGTFDSSVAQKIVVPNASQCLRVVLMSTSSMAKLELVVKSLAPEYRSPPFVIVVDHADAVSEVCTKALAWTKRNVSEIRDVNTVLAPNVIYVTSADTDWLKTAEKKYKWASYQFLSSPPTGFRFETKSPTTQVLIEEDLKRTDAAIEARIGSSADDVTPATSFSSLSLEFFARLRTKAA